MPEESKPDLPQRIRKNRIFRVAAWVTVMLTIAFLITSKTRWYRVHHHRSALHALQRGMFLPQPQSWRGYLRTEAIFWLLSKNLAFEQKVQRAQHHMEELLELGYLEERRFYFRNPSNAVNSAVTALQPFLSPEEVGTEYTLTFSGSNIIVTAPPVKIPKLAQAIESFNAWAETNAASIK